MADVNIAADVLNAGLADETPQANPEVSTPAKAGRPAGEEQEPQGTENDGEETPEQKQKRQGGWQRKIAKLERENDQLRELALRGVGSPKAADTVKPEAKEDPKPALDNFDTHEAWVEAMSEWSGRKAVREYRQAVELEKKEAEAKAQQQTVQQKWAASVDEAATKYSDFREVAMNPELPVTQAMADALIEADNGNEVLYHLGKHPEEAARIAKLSGVQAVLEIGKLASRLASPEQEEKKTPPVSQAPDPVVPIRRGTGAHVKSIHDPDLSFKDFCKLRDADKGK